MFKKSSIAALVAILLTMMVTAVVSADTPDPGIPMTDQGPRHRLMIGQVLEIGIGDFTVEDPRGETHTIMVTEDTIFRSRSGDPSGEEASEASFDDLTVGNYVGVHLGEDGARLVVLLPDDFDPAALRGIRLAGEVNMVTVGGGFFKMDTRNGETLTITVDEKTRYLGGVDSLEGLEKGDKVGVLAQEQEDGTLLAKAVATRKVERPILNKQGGKLTGIDGQQITITDRDGQAFIFNTTEETRFGSRDGEVDGLEDLELDMILIVVFNPEQNDLARAVLVADPALLSLERAHGEVHNTANSKLTITTGEGDKITFAVDENTRIRGREIEGLDDLTKGMKALVLFQVQEDGTLLAKGILAGEPRSQMPQPQDPLP